MSKNNHDNICREQQQPGFLKNIYFRDYTNGFIYLSE